MGIRLKPASYGPIRILTGPGHPLRYQPHDGIAAAHPPSGAPALTMLASLGACLAMSLEWCAKQCGVDLGAMTVELTGLKAADMPSRFEQIEIVVEPENGPGALTEELLNQAKQICTVSNSLNCQLSFTIV